MINLNKYDPSDLNTAGVFLRKPLVKLIKHNILALNPPLSYRFFEVIRTLTKIFLFVFCLPIFAIPAYLLSKLGERITVFSSAQISLKGLKITLPPVVLPDPLAVEHLEISLIATTIHSSNTKDNRSGLKRMCSELSLGPKKFADRYQLNITLAEAVCKETSVYLKYIKLKLDREDIPVEKKDEILKELNRAGAVCYPTWLEVSRKHYDNLYNNPSDFSIKLIKIIREYKEDLILNYAQKNFKEIHWNILNAIRNSLGKDLGLTADHNYDIYYTSLPFLYKIMCKVLFIHKLRKVNQFVQGVQTKINAERVVDPLFHDELVKMMKEYNVPNPEDFVAENFFDHNYKINFRGTNLLLRKIRVIV